MKKIISILLVLVMMFCFAPMAFAGYSNLMLYNYDLDANQGKYYPCDSSTCKIINSPTEIMPEGGWVMYKDGVLTFHDFDISAETGSDTALVVGDIDLIINVDNSHGEWSALSDTSITTGIDGSNAKSITITGNGELDVCASKNAIITENLIFDDDFEGELYIYSIGDDNSTALKVDNLTVNNGLVQTSSRYGIPGEIGEINFNNGFLLFLMEDRVAHGNENKILTYNRINLGKYCFAKALENGVDIDDADEDVLVNLDGTKLKDYQAAYFYYDDTVSPETGVNDTLVLLSVMVLSVIAFAVSRKVRKN